MSDTLLDELSAIKDVEDTVVGNKVANFAYDDYAYEHNDANGVDTYNVNNHQNIPNGTASIMKVNSTILTKGWRAQASAITRMAMNHFLGRISYNLNKLHDNFSGMLNNFVSYIGQPNGLATLDTNGRLPYSQLSTIISLSDTVITGNIGTGDTIKVRFTANITGQDTSTPLAFTYNETAYQVKAYKEGSLVSIFAKELTSNNYTYIHTGIFLDLFFDGEQFIVIGNPIILSGIDYTIYANGKVGDECVGTVKALTTVNVPYGWKKGEGQAISRTEYKDLFEAYRDQTYDSNPAHTLLSRYGIGDGSTTFNLPNYSEVSLVGVGSNSTDSVSTHDTFTQGEFKDDQVQNHTHSITDPGHKHAMSQLAFTYSGQGIYDDLITSYSSTLNSVDSSSNTTGITINNPNSGRHDDVTRGKSKGVTFIVKVLP